MKSHLLTVVSLIVVSLIGVLLPTLARSQILVYDIHGDHTVDMFGEVSTNLGALSGIAKIDTSGPDPELVELQLSLTTNNGDIPGATTCCAATTIQLAINDAFGANALPQVGTGSTTTSISWGSLSWGQGAGGQLTCNVTTGPTCPGCTTPCDSLFGGTGALPVPALSAASYDTDPWVFTMSGDTFTSSPIEIRNLGGGLYTEQIVIKGPVTLASLPTGEFCVVGPSTGLDWSWEINGLGPVDVTNPGGSADDLAQAFVNSIKAQFGMAYASVSTPTNCFKINFGSSFLFKVGPKGGPSACTVSGNGSGCPFNPFIYEKQFVSWPVPAVPRWGIYAMALLVLVLTGVVLTRIRRSSA